MTNKILVIDDEESVCYSFKRILKTPDFLVDTVRNGTRGTNKFKNSNYDLVILDIRLPDMSGLDVLEKIKCLDPNAVVLVITAHGTTETAIEATKRGAFDYIQKPFEVDVMKRLIDESLQYSRLIRTKVILDAGAAEDHSGDRMIGKSNVMQEVYKMIGRVAGSDVNILIRGESGTGKELIARAIFQHSHRASKPFLIVNCAAIPETLLESELFGYEKGAFTGAVQRKIGKFEQADKGTLFLDEIGDMTLSTQAKILRVLQEGCFERLGGQETIHIDVRIIAATNRHLEKAINENHFREDLYYRIKVVTITVPPLRLRKQDIPDLINYFLEKHVPNLRKEQITLAPDVLEAMILYHWPGNVRELENVMKRGIVLAKGNVISKNLISEEFASGKETADKNQSMKSILSNLGEDKTAFYGHLYEKVIGEAEKALIEQVLRETGCNQVQAAKILGISRIMLRERMRKYKINKEITIK